MEKDFEIEEIEFDETLFEKNIGENDFTDVETDGFGTDKNGISFDQDGFVGDDENATN